MIVSQFEVDMIKTLGLVRKRRFRKMATSTQNGRLPVRDRKKSQWAFLFVLVRYTRVPNFTHLRQCGQRWRSIGGATEPFFHCRVRGRQNIKFFARRDVHAKLFENRFTGKGRKRRRNARNNRKQHNTNTASPAVTLSLAWSVINYCNVLLFAVMQ